MCIYIFKLIWYVFVYIECVSAFCHYTSETSLLSGDDHMANSLVRHPGEERPYLLCTWPTLIHDLAVFEHFIINRV